MIRPVAQAPAPAAPPADSYGQILKASAWIGGSSLLTMLIGMVRMKVMALLLGPAGVGMLGVYGVILELVRSVAGMGINSSGVRQIAEASASQDAGKLARTATVLRRISLALALTGALLLALSSPIWSGVSFGSQRYAPAIGLLSGAVFFHLLAEARGALLQGLRRIDYQAKNGVLGALWGTLFSLPVVYVYRQDGIVPSLVIVAAMSLVTSWWYSRKLHIRSTRMTPAQLGSEAGALLRLGVVFMASGLLVLGAAYAVRIVVLRHLGLEAAGLYQSAWALGGLYVGFILQAMGADFYPRLVGAAADHRASNRLVNEQALVSLLLAGPGVLATITLAPLVLHVFYSGRFMAAVDTLRWICLGMAMRIVTWPIGFIMVAQGLRRSFFLTELAWALVDVVLAWICIGRFGLEGAGMAFLAAYLVHAALVYAVARRATGFAWSAANRRIALLFMTLLALTMLGFEYLSSAAATAVGLVIVVASGLYSVHALARLVPAERMPRQLLRLCRIGRQT